jgi:hypothetical protein
LPGPAGESSTRNSHKTIRSLRRTWAGHARRVPDASNVSLGSHCVPDRHGSQSGAKTRALANPWVHEARTLTNERNPAVAETVSETAASRPWKWCGKRPARRESPYHIRRFSTVGAGRGNRRLNARYRSQAPPESPGSINEEGHPNRRGVTFFVCGGRGIRTHDGCNPIAVFKPAAISGGPVLQAP